MPIATMPGSNDDRTDPAVTIRDATAIFSRELTSVWNREKTPYGLQDSMVHARSAPPESTSRIFYDTDFTSWLAYFLVWNKCHSRSHYKGQRFDKNTLLAFDQLAIEDRQAVAAVLSNVQIQPTVQSAIERLQANSKRRKTMSMDPSLSGSRNTHFASIVEPEICLAAEEPRFMPTPVSSQFPSNNTMKTNSHDQQILSNPTAKLLATIFPQYICGAIRKYNEKAAATMVFPSQLSEGKIECLLSLSILPNKVQYLAMKLFGVNLEIDGMSRYIVQDNGAKLLVGEVVLQAAEGEAAITELLGPEISAGIEMSPLRKEEVRQGLLLTNCIMLRVTGNSLEDGILNLNLGLEEGFNLKCAFFKE